MLIQALNRWQLVWRHQEKGVLSVEEFPSYEALMQRVEDKVNWARERLNQKEYSFTISTIHSVWTGTTETRYP